MKLRTKFMATIAVILFILSAVDVWLTIRADRRIVLNDIQKWSFLFAENVRVSLNSLMREGKMDLRFTLFDGMKTEIEGLKDVRVIRSKKVDEIFMIAGERDVIPKEKKRIKAFLSEISTLKEELARSSDKDEADDMRNQINSLQANIARSEGIINDVLKPGIIDEREQAIDALDRKVLESGEIIYDFKGDQARVVIPYKAKEKGCSESSGCHRYAETGDVLGAINLEFSIAETNAQIRANEGNLILLAIVKLVFILLAIHLILSLAITGPIQRVESMLREIAEGKGDLTKRLTLSSSDEIGILSRWFNKFIDGLQQLIKEILSSLQYISHSSKIVMSVSDQLKESSQIQKSTMEETYSSIDLMIMSMRAVTLQTDEQLEATEEVSSSILQSIASIKEVAQNADQLSQSAEKTASAINEIGASLNSVSHHVDSLFIKTEEVVSASAELSATVNEVSSHAKEKAILAQKVRDDASTLGLDAVNKTRSGMDKIRKEVALSSEIIDRLEERSREIGQITDVIQEITETTKLLSLNAAIMSAKAGIHGRGFAVVANEVKNLAKKTSAATKEIHSLIATVQKEAAAAKKSMKASSISVDEGVTLSSEAGDALTEIMKSAGSSLDMAKKVNLATYEQSNVLSQVTKSIHEINGMVEEIKRATDEQKTASREIIKITEETRDATRSVRNSTREQTRENDYIAGIVEEMSAKMKAIANSTTQQNNTADSIIGLIEKMKEMIQANALLSEKLHSSVSELTAQQGNLDSRVSSFKVE